MMGKSYAKFIDNLNIYKDCISYSPNGVIILDGKNKIIEFNHSVEILTGVRRGMAINQNYLEIFPQIALEPLKNEEHRCLVNGYDLLVKRKVFTNSKNGQSSYQVIILQDLSATVQLAMEVESSKHMVKELEMVFEGSFDGILVTDKDGNVLMVNKAYGRLTAITKEEMTGKNMRDLLNPSYMKNSVALVVAREKKSVSMHHITRHGKSVIATGMPVFDDTGELYRIVINLRDISEIYKLREELLKAKAIEKMYFRKLMSQDNDIEGPNAVVFANEKMRKLFSLAKKISNYNVTVLILGESGVGKEEMAKFIHESSIRKDSQFIAINCSAIPENLLESELFGYEKGAFTGAIREGKKGLFEVADGGTLFLDEIGDMPLNMQVKMLRFLEGHEITRVGSTKAISVDVRILAATNKNLKEMIKKNTFREDLYYRLNVIQINIPPLRERVEDIPPLCLHFLQYCNKRYGQNKKMTYDIVKEMQDYPWHGNVRELRNVIEKMVVLSSNEYLEPTDLPWNADDMVSTSEEFLLKNTKQIMSLNEAIENVERNMLIAAMKKYKSSRQIAKVLKIDQSTVVRKIEKYGLKNKNENLNI